MKRYAVVGFGCAGYHAAKTIREWIPDCRIDVYSDTDKAPANPMLTTYYVGGKIPWENLFPFGGKEEVIEELKIDSFMHSTVEKVSASERSVMAGGKKEMYDDIVLASGANALVPPIAGLPGNGVFVMRTVKDAERLLEAVKSGTKSALIIGASWVGIKVAEALRIHHVSCVLADMAPYIFPTACLPEVAVHIQEKVQKLGVELKFGSGISSMREEEDGIVSVFTDADEIKTDIVVLCMGVRPSVSYLDSEEIAIGRGVRVNCHMRTNAAHIYAVGDCCETIEIMSGEYMPVNLWANAVVQGQIAGKNIAGYPDKFEGAFAHNITHFFDMDFIGLGNPRLPGEVVEFGEMEKGNYIRAVIRDGKLKCANILGNYRISGFFKHWFTWQQERPGEVIPTWLCVGLQREGISEAFIALLGGNEL